MDSPADVTKSTFRPLADISRMWGANARSVDELKRHPRRVAEDILRLFIANGTPITLWGPVGSRKTRTIEALAREVDENGKPYQVITMQPSTQDPTIIHGMMYTAEEDGTTVMRRSIPAVAQQVMNYAGEGGLTILFADEMTTCMPSQQNAMLGLLTHGRFEGIDISPYIAIVMAANPEGTVSTVLPLSEAVLNRGGHIAWFGDQALFLEQWATGFNGAMPAPEESTVDLMRRTFTLRPDRVFRAPKRWKPEALVPWESLEHTERAVTEAGRIIELVERTFASHDKPIVDFYIVEVSRALLGPDWADAVATALSVDSPARLKRIPISWIRAVGLENFIEETSMESLVAKGGTLWPESMRQDEATAVMEALVSSLEEALDDPRKTPSAETYYAAWAFASAAPDEQRAAGLSSLLGRLTVVGSKSAKTFLRGAHPVPPSVPPHVRELAKSAASRLLGN